MNSLLNDLSALTGVPPLLLTVVITWSLFWKGLAMWKAARKNSPFWFVALIFINTIGIFEILYIYLFSEIKLDDLKTKKVKKKRTQKIYPKVLQKAFIDN